MSITIVGGGNPSGPTFPVQRSVRLRSSATAYFSRTFGTPTNNLKWTLSGWIKKGGLGTTVSNGDQAFIAAPNGGNADIFFIEDNGTDQFSFFINSVVQARWTPVYRDPSSWYHVVLVYDSANATQANRLLLYINGVQITTLSTAVGISLNQSTTINANAVINRIGNNAVNTRCFDGYMTEVNFIDGQALTPTSFGAYNSYGVWSPAKYSGTYGTNGFYLNFQDNSAATAAAIGKDSSGNGNNWTPNNISVTAGVTYDSMLDVPTLTSANNANFATLNPIDSYAAGLSQANLNFANGAGLVYQAFSTIANPDITANKFYCEVTVDTGYGVCIAVDTKSGSNSATTRTGVLSYYANGQKYNDTTGTAYGATFTAGDIIGIAMGNGQLEFFKNGTSQGVAFSSLTGAYKFGVWAAGATGTGCSFNFGQRPFTYTPPSGFKSLNTYNLPAPTIPNGATQFAATLWTGTGVERNIDNSVNGKSFQPDLVWLKRRSSADSNGLFDAVRGASKRLQSNDTGAEATTTAVQSAFLSNGFTVGTDVQSNGSGSTYVGWQWKANGTPAVTNTSGTIPSTISANTTAGFSIVTYTGTGANATVGHGLGVAPKMVIVKQRNSANSWIVYQSSLGATKYLRLETTDASATATAVWNDTAPTSSVFTVGTSGTTNGSTATYVAYCFSEIAGYSKFGSYTGNASTDGPFVYTGFRPRWIMIKNTTLGGAGQSDWYIYDTARNAYNVTNLALAADLSSAEVTATNEILDILSNGFKLRGSSNVTNNTGNTYIYAAFAENPFNYSLAR